MDARVRYTQKVIRDSLFSILSEKTIDKITVKEICEKAEINRATFYKYYENAYDLLNKIEMETLDNLEAELEKVNSDIIIDSFRVILNDFLDKREMYRILFLENGDELFKKRLFSICYGDSMVTIKKHFPELDETRQEWLYYFIAEGCNGILTQWLKGGMKEPPAEVLIFIGKLIESINGKQVNNTITQI